MSRLSSSKMFIFPLSMLCITLLAGTISILPGTSADTSPIDDNITITVDSACTMGQTVLSSSNTLNPGETSTIGSSRIAAYCNDSEGYAIYAIGYTGGEYGNTNLISAQNPNHTIPTGTSSALGNASYWNMQLTPGTASDPTTTTHIPTIENNFTTSSNIPANYTKVASYSSATIPQQQDPTTSGSYFTTTYQSHISTTQPAGVYNGAVQYIMVHPVGAPAPEVPYIMQNTEPIKHKLTNVGDSLQATDTRDGKKYWVTKEADGNIWMTQNLDLDLDSTKTYTPEDTDVQSAWTPLNSTADYSGSSIIGHWYNDSRKPYSLNPGEKFYYTSNNEDSDITYQSLNACEQDGYEDCLHYHSGNYYNWPAATASNDISEQPEQSNSPNSICPAGWRLPIKDIVTYTSELKKLLVVQGNILGDPLPYGSGYHWQENGFNIVRAAPLYLTRAGFISYYGTSGSWRIYNTATAGYYWTGSIRDNSSDSNRNAYGPDFGSSAFYDSVDLTMDGNTIRCIAR